MVELALLGCGGGMPMPKRFLSSLLISYRGRKLLIDCGEGTQVSMRILGWGFKSIDIICITHGHGDHIVGLPGMLATIGNSGRTEPMTIIGPEGIVAMLNGLRTIVPYLPYDINVIENPQNSLSMNMGENCTLECMEAKGRNSLKFASGNEDITVSTLNVDHSAPCIGYGININRRPKFEVERALENQVPKMLWNKLQKGEPVTWEGRAYEPDMVLGRGRRGIKLTYITDTRPTESIPEFIRGSDLFVCEGTYGSEDDLEKAINNKHMTFREAAELARAGGVKELLLTHFSPAMNNPEEYKENAMAVYPTTVIGYDRLVKTLKFAE